MCNNWQIIHRAHSHVHQNGIGQRTIRHLNGKAVVAIEVCGWRIGDIATHDRSTAVTRRAGYRPAQAVTVSVGGGKSSTALSIFISGQRACFALTDDRRFVVWLRHSNHEGLGHRITVAIVGDQTHSATATCFGWCPADRTGCYIDRHAGWLLSQTPGQGVVFGIGGAWRIGVFLTQYDRRWSHRGNHWGIVYIGHCNRERLSDTATVATIRHSHNHVGGADAVCWRPGDHTAAADAHARRCRIQREGQRIVFDVARQNSVRIFDAFGCRRYCGRGDFWQVINGIHRHADCNRRAISTVRHHHNKGIGTIEVRRWLIGHRTINHTGKTVSGCTANRPVQAVIFNVRSRQYERLFFVFVGRQYGRCALIDNWRIVQLIHGHGHFNRIAQLTIRKQNSEAVAAVEVLIRGVGDVATGHSRQAVARCTGDRPAQDIAISISCRQCGRALSVFVSRYRSFRLINLGGFIHRGDRHINDDNVSGCAVSYLNSEAVAAVEVFIRGVADIAVHHGGRTMSRCRADRPAQ